MRLIFLLVALSLTGCTSFSPREADCWPSEVAKVTGRPARVAMVEAEDTNGQTVMLARMVYQVSAEKAILVLTDGHHIIAVDANTLDPLAPAYLDTGMVSENGDLIAGGTPSCQWRRHIAGARTEAILEAPFHGAALAAPDAREPHALGFFFFGG